ncbi:carbamoyltransferase C-terminal domain-containing protein [Amycolatopsis japonica]|uniref:carbamoyltransferase C-terminal domain-containing protein n=1 Tax=Amycolatopsis japonica TaxID=208439 RepID=UPI0036731B59
METLICGLKLTHDGCLAVVSEDELLFSIEAEKIDNRPRYSSLNTVTDLSAVLGANGIAPGDLTAIAVDGWFRQDGESQVTLVNGTGRTDRLEVAEYHDEPGSDVSPLTGIEGEADFFDLGGSSFRSYTHTTGHALSAYCSSPYAAADEPSLVVVWDGGTMPCLYHFSPTAPALSALRRLTPVMGLLYPIFATHLEPFTPSAGTFTQSSRERETMLLSVSGKAMAYAALDEPSPELIAVMARTTQSVPPSDPVGMHRWTRKVLGSPAAAGLSDAALMASFEEYLGQTLLQSLAEFLRNEPRYRGLPLCFAGGSALNIKWNALLRESGLFAGVWVPPFPNDAGSAIGTACAEMIRSTGRSALRWSAFAGPALPTEAPIPEGWHAEPCSVPELAALLADSGEPVVVLSGRAEVGPRALGHRSIIAPATSPQMQDRLNKLKKREPYRPVAPICLEDRAPEFFAPGTRDPYMLFDHEVRPEWRDRLPAIVHVDGSARLQTVGPDNQVMFDLLTAYAERTGVPVLCNTSANFEGSGFFPDVASAVRWGRTRFVWSEGTLFSRNSDSASEAAP